MVASPRVLRTTRPPASHHAARSVEYPRAGPKRPGPLLAGLRTVHSAPKASLMAELNGLQAQDPADIQTHWQRPWLSGSAAPFLGRKFPPIPQPARTCKQALIWLFFEQATEQLCKFESPNNTFLCLRLPGHLPMPIPETCHIIQRDPITDHIQRDLAGGGPAQSVGEHTILHPGFKPCRKRALEAGTCLA